MNNSTARTPRGAAGNHFLANVDVVQQDCNLWPYSTNGVYGKVWLNGRLEYVHVAACERRWGPKPDPRMYACHGRLVRCVSTLCFNGDHLSWQTAGVNQQQRLADGTAQIGELAHGAKRTATDVLAIRAAAADGVAVGVLAREYGMSHSAISMIVSRKRWKHL